MAKKEKPKAFKHIEFNGYTIHLDLGNEHELFVTVYGSNHMATTGPHEQEDGGTMVGFRTCPGCAMDEA